MEHGLKGIFGHLSILLGTLTQTKRLTSHMLFLGFYLHYVIISSKQQNIVKRMIKDVVPVIDLPIFLNYPIIVI